MHLYWYSYAIFFSIIFFPFIYYKSYEESKLLEEYVETTVKNSLTLSLNTENLLGYNIFERNKRISESAGITPATILIPGIPTSEDGNAHILSVKGKLYIVIDYLLAKKGKYVADGIIAHELGHIFNEIKIKKYLFLAHTGFIGCFEFYFSLYVIFRLFLHFPEITSVFLNLSFTFYLLRILFLVAKNILSREEEYRADKFAISLLEKPESFIEWLENYPRENIEINTSSGFLNKVLMFTLGDHPPIHKRVERMRLQVSQKNS